MYLCKVLKVNYFPARAENILKLILELINSKIAMSRRKKKIKIIAMSKRKKKDLEYKLYVPIVSATVRVSVKKSI